MIKRFLMWVLAPLIQNASFFINVLLLLILPTVLNAYCINTDEYISFSSSWRFGILVKYGASFPYILFIPYVISYILSMILYIINPIYIKKLFKIVVYGLLILLFAINIFLLFNFRTMLSPSIILLLNETNNGEIHDFMQSYLFDMHSLYAYFIFCIMAFFVVMMESKSNIIISLVNNKIFKTLILIFTIYMFYRSINPFRQFLKMYECKDLDSLEFWYLDYRPDTNMFTNVLYSFYTHMISKNELLQSKESTLGLNQGSFSNSNSIIVLVIGESFNKHHSELYGYTYATNPHLSREQKKGNLFAFSDVVTPYNMTSHVMKNLFSVNSMMDNESWGNYPIFPAIFRDAGFNVYFWDNQKTAGKADVSDYSIFSYLYDPDVVKMSYTECNLTPYEYDMDLLMDFFNTVGEIDEKSLVIFHIRGQHDMAENRYPQTKEYIYFTSDSIIGDYSDKQKSQIAFYDNATRYNDDVMYRLISKLREQESVIVYLSDHGEEVHDYRNHYGRTQENKKTPNILKYQYEIPFLIWCSDKYMEKNPDIMSHIQSSINKPFMIDNTCQILFDLALISNCVYYHKERDLISPSYQPYDYRRVQDNVIYEDVMKETPIK